MPFYKSTIYTDLALLPITVASPLLTERFLVVGINNRILHLNILHSYTFIISYYIISTTSFILSIK